MAAVGVEGGGEGCKKEGKRMKASERDVDVGG